LNAVIDAEQNFSLEKIIPNLETEFKTINLGVIGNNFESTFDPSEEPF